MSSRGVFAGVALVAALAGIALWLANSPETRDPPVELAPAALFAATFRDTNGQEQALGRFEGKWLVLNFWATWCAPCREEMPGFERLQARWSGRNVQFVGVAHDDPVEVARFGTALGIHYPLLTGGDEVDELARRLGNRAGVVPYTVLIDPRGHVLQRKVGAYSVEALDAELQEIVATKAARID